ncbi:MAG: endonuclease III [Nitrospirota bacterium]|nr:endonuclease III [Nitrospirota bacterium]MDH5587583.1 endonuclease III [Nitrospirota bacterium]MDH5773885.1 endonuclease III [Nitrospirota bacterium]
MVASRVGRKASSRSERTQAAAKQRVASILATLQQAIPDAKVALDSSNPLELLVATILSAQCTDDRVNQVTPNLFAKYRTAEDFAKADQVELESLIKSTGFYKSKAKHLIGCAKTLVANFQGKIPQAMDELTTLPGVGRKTANVILGSYFGEPAVVVDTHVKRVANRLDLTRSQDPTKIEEDLQSLMPKAQWTIGAQRLLLHGRHVCQARIPHCDQCSLYDLCEWEGKRTRA